MQPVAQIDVQQGVELADPLEQSDPATVVKRAGDGDTQGPSGAAWASAMADAKPLTSSSAGACGSMARRRTLPGTSRPALRLTRAEVTWVPPISSAPTSSGDSAVSSSVTARTPS